MSNLVGHQVLQVNAPGNSPQTSVLSVTVPGPVLLPDGKVQPAPITLATCHLTAYQSGANGTASVFISGFVKDGQSTENVEVFHLHENGITEVTFTLNAAGANATGVGLVFAGL